MNDVLSIQIVFLMIAGIIASYYDQKKGIIPNKITYSMIGIGIILSIATNNWIAFPIAGFIGLFTIGLFFLNKMGGGDGKFLIGMALIQPIYLGYVFPFIVMIVSSIICLVHNYNKKPHLFRLAPYLSVGMFITWITLFYIGG